MKKTVLILALALITAMLFIGCENEHQPPCTDSTHSWKVIKEVKASCTSKGFISAKCEVCGKEKAEVLPMLEHTLTEDSRKCSVCKRAIYTSLEDFNENATLENTKNVVNEINLSKGYGYSDIAYTDNNSGYTGKGLLIGRTDNDPLNKHSAKPAKEGEYKFIFKNGIINSAADGYNNINGHPDSAVYMLIPGNSEVTFEDVTFNGVFSFRIQPYTSPWSYLKKLEFNNCTFNGIIIGTCYAEDYIVDGCTFNNFKNQQVENNSNPIWITGKILSDDGDTAGEAASLKNFVFKNNKVYSSRPVKIEGVGKNSQSLNYVPNITVLDNYFDITFENSDDKPNQEKHMAFNIGQFDANSPFYLIDDGNEISEGTVSLYTAVVEGNASNKFYEVAGTKIMDRENREKTIEGVVWKSDGTKTYTMKSIPKE